MDIRKLQRLVVDALEDVKGADIRVFNSTGLTQLFDRVIIASGTSNRQTKALAASVRDKVKGAGGHVVSVEGADTGEWVLVDLGDAIVHVMQPAIRAYYNLEEIWGAKPISLKSLDEADAVLARSAASRQAAAADPERTLVARKTAARKAAAGKLATKADATAVAPRKRVAGPRLAVPDAGKDTAVDEPGAMTTEDALDGTLPMSPGEEAVTSRTDTSSDFGGKAPVKKRANAVEPEKAPAKKAAKKAATKKVTKKAAAGTVAGRKVAGKNTAPKAPAKAVDRRSPAKKAATRSSRSKTSG